MDYRAYPHLYEINTWFWLEELSAEYGREIRLANVPDAEWDRLQHLEFDFVYLMGVWRRSLIGRGWLRKPVTSVTHPLMYIAMSSAAWITHGLVLTSLAMACT